MFNNFNISDKMFGEEETESIVHHWKDKFHEDDLTFI